MASFWDQLKPEDSIGAGNDTGRFWDGINEANMIGGGAATGKFWDGIKTTEQKEPAQTMTKWSKIQSGPEWSKTNKPQATMSTAAVQQPLKPEKNFIQSTLSNIEKLGEGAANYIAESGKKITEEQKKFNAAQEEHTALTFKMKRGEQLTDEEKKRFTETGNEILNRSELFSVGFTEPLKNINGLIGRLIKTKSAQEAADILRNAGVAEDITKEYAPIIAKTENENDVVRMVDAIDNLRTTTKPAVEAGEKTISQAVPPAISTKEAPLLSRTLSETVSDQVGFPLQQTKPVVGKSQDSVQIVIDALKEAKPVRGKQEALYSKERSEISSIISNIEKVNPGEAGYIQQLGAIKAKGPLTKVEFEGIKSKITQDVVDDLFKKISQSESLLPFQKLTAKTGLSKLIGAHGGVVPTKNEISLLEQVFGNQFTEAVLDKQPGMQKLWGAVENTLNLPRAIQSTADLSAPLRQGIFLIGRPKQFVPAFVDMFKYAFSDMAYKGLMDNIKARPTYKLMVENKLALTDVGGNLLDREEAFMSNLAEQIPLFGKIAKGSNRAYSGFLNKLRADVFDDIIKRSKIIQDDTSGSQIASVAKFINAATGRGELPKFLQGSAPILNAVFYSPRLMASRLSLLNPAFYVRLNSVARKEALKSLLSFAAVVSSVIGLAKMNKDVEVNTDPRNADFLKIKIGNTRYDIMGGFQQYLVTAYRLLSNQMVSSATGKEFNLGEGYKATTRKDIMEKFFENKESPIASFVMGLLEGKNPAGDKFNVSGELLDRFIPMVTQDIYDLYREDGAQGLLMSFPGVFGVGSQTYGDKIPLESRTSTGKPTITWRSQENLGESIINKITGTKIEPVSVKKFYDEAQALIAQGRTNEAQKIVNNLSDEDYELYKKFKERDKRIASDQIKAKLIPIYEKNKELIRQGRQDEAKKIVESMTDEEYAIYKKIKAEDYATVK